LENTTKLNFLLVLFLSLAASVSSAAVAPVRISTQSGEAIEIDLTSSITGVTDPQVQLVSQPQKGAAVVSGLTITYTPNQGVQNDVDTFSYGVDNDGVLEQATITVTIGAATVQGETPADATAELFSQNCLQENIPGQLEDECRLWESLVAAGATEDLREFYQQMAPAELAAQASVSGDMARQQIDNIVRRLTSLHQGLNEAALGKLSFKIDDKSFVLSDFAGDTGGGASADTQKLGNYGWYINGNINTGAYEETDYEDGYEFFSGSLTTGLDYRFSDIAVIGGALGFGGTNAEFDYDTGNFDAQGITATFYASYFPSQRTNLDLILSANTQDLSYLTVRSFSTLYYECNGSTSSTLMTASLAGGVDALQRGSMTWSFSARGDYYSTNIEGYEETGCDGAYAVEQRNVDQFFSDVKTVLSIAQSYSWGVLVHQFDASWIHGFTDEPETITISKVAAPGNFSEFKTNIPDTDYYKLAYGIQFIRPGGNTGYIQLQTTLDKEYYYDVGLAAGYRTEF